jgi:hypothetical protein
LLSRNLDKGFLFFTGKTSETGEALTLTSRFITGTSVGALSVFLVGSGGVDFVNVTDGSTGRVGGTSGNGLETVTLGVTSCETVTKEQVLETSGTGLIGEVDGNAGVVSDSDSGSSGSGGVLDSLINRDGRDGNSGQSVVGKSSESGLNVRVSGGGSAGPDNVVSGPGSTIGISVG